MCRGIFAGSSTNLSLQSTFAILANYEKNHGSVIKGGFFSKPGVHILCVYVCECECALFHVYSVSYTRILFMTQLNTCTCTCSTASFINRYNQNFPLMIKLSSHFIFIHTSWQIMSVINYQLLACVLLFDCFLLKTPAYICHFSSHYFCLIELSDVESNSLVLRGKREKWQIYTLQGGLETLIEALRIAAMDAGVDIRLNTEVTGIDFQGKQAKVKPYTAIIQYTK